MYFCGDVSKQTLQQDKGKNSNLVNFACELGAIMTRYDFLEARRMILNNVRIDFNLT